MLPPHSGDARYSERGAGAKHKTRYRWTALMMETDLLHAMDSPGQAVQGHPSAAKRRARGPSRLEGGEPEVPTCHRRNARPVHCFRPSNARAGGMDGFRSERKHAGHPWSHIHIFSLVVWSARPCPCFQSGRLLVPLPLDTSLLPPLLANSHSLLICSC